MVGNTEVEEITNGGAVPAVQLPSNVFQNYGEVEEDDPYRYYQPNYPAPRPVAPDDPALALNYEDQGQLSRRSRSVDGKEEKEADNALIGPKRRLRRGGKVQTD